MSTKRIAFIRTSDLYFDSRSIRSLEFFQSKGYSGYVIGWSRHGKGVKNFDRFVDSSYSNPAGIGRGWANAFKIISFNIHVLKKLCRLDVDLIYACDLDSAISAKLVSKVKRIPLVLDQYDSYTSRFRSRSLQQIFSRLEGYVFKSANVRIFASEERLELAGIRDSFVIENCPTLRLKREFQPNEKLKVFFGGIYLQNRYLEEILELASNTNEFDLSFAGYGPLHGLIEEYTRFPNIYNHGPVTTDEMLVLLSKQDLCLAIYNPLDPNNKVAAVSKVYESAIAGTPIVAAEGTSTEKIITTFQLGWKMKFGESSDFMSILRQRKSWEKEQYDQYIEKCDFFLDSVNNWNSNTALLSKLEDLVNFT